MNTYKLSYATVNIIHDTILEVVCNDEIELSIEMLKELKTLADKKIGQPFSLLINRKNTYTYSFEVLQHFGDFHDILATAFVVYNKTSEAVTNYAVEFIKNQNWKTEVFYNHEAAVQWLLKESKSNS